MKIAGVTGAEADGVARTLVDRLADRGRVARVRAGGAVADGGALVAEERADTTYDLTDGQYRATGEVRSVDEVLDDLAPDHDYAIVTGHEESAIAHVVVGEGPYEGEVLVRVAPTDRDLDAAVEAIDDVADHETLESLLDRAAESMEANRSGAVATFTGRVRERDDPDDTPTTHLEFEMYDGVAQERMAAIESELEEREGVFEVVLHHRTGVVEAGEDIVFVVVLAGHRDEAFRTVSDGIDRLKAEVPIFKKEVTLDGEFWAHERP